MKGIILTAGLGTRLHPITHFINKNLLPIGNKPMFFHPLQTLIDSGIKDIVIVVGPPHGNQIKNILEYLPIPKNINIVFVNQPKPLGMPDAINKCRQFIMNNSMIVIAGDNIYGSNFSKEVSNFKTGALSFLRKVHDPQRFGVPIYNSKKQLIQIEEKPKYPATNWVVTGPHLFDNSVFDKISHLKLSTRGELEISELNSLYIQENNLSLVKREDFWIDAGTFESLAEANHCLFKKNRNKLKKMKILLVEPPNRFPADAHPRPNGSLGPVCIAGALRDAGFEVQLLDATVGLNYHSLKDTFYHKSQPDEKGLVRIGMSERLIAKVVKGYNLIGVTSIFTPQTTEALKFAHIVKQANPNAFLIAGGINAWSLADRFLQSGYDAIGVGEGELLMVNLAKTLAQGKNWKRIPGLLYKKNGRVVSSGKPNLPLDINSLPIPAFDLWPLKKYWEISAPHGGDFPPGMIVKYASLETSRGCPFSCSYCHNSSLKDNSPAGPIGKLRLKSIDRVMQEVDFLKSLGAEWLFFEDDSLLAVPNRAIEIFQKISDRDLHLADVNGVNLIHFYKKGANGQMQIRQDLIKAMMKAGFNQLVLPFESGSKRIIDKYASGKWNPEIIDVGELVTTVHKLGLKIPGNFMLGFPDETPKELQQTINLAKKLIKKGLTYASFFIVVPYPGSKLYTEALVNGYLDLDFDPDLFHWGNPVMKNITIPGEELIRLRKDLWKTINNSEFVGGKVIRQVIPEI